MITEYERAVIAQGSEAFAKGFYETANPFARNDYYREVWHEGWRLARDVSMFKAMRKA